MKHPRILRLALSHGLLGSALLASPVFALTPAEFDSLQAKASRGNAVAQYNLGLAYADDDASPYDPAQAYAWLSLAAANGTTGKALTELTARLTAEQLADGNRRLAALTATPVSPVGASFSPILAVDEPAAPVSIATDQEHKKLSAELAAAWKENELLKAGLTAKLADANKRVSIAEAALASKDKEIASLQSLLVDATAKPAAENPELVSLRAERDQLQAKANAAATELTDLRASLEKAAAEQSALRGKLANAINEMSEARRAQGLAEAEASSLKAAADRASAERLAVAAQLETVTEALAAAKAAPAPALSDTGIAALKADRDRLAENARTLEQERDALAAKLTEATQRVAAGETALADKEKEIAALQSRIAEATAPKPTDSVAETELATLKTDRDRLTETVKALEQERDSLTAQLAAAKAVVAPVAATPEVIVEPVPTAPAPDTEAINRLAELEKAKAETDTKLEAALRTFTLQQAEIDRLQNSLASIDGERAATATKLDAVTAELNAQLAAANQTIAEQKTSLAAANANLADARQTVDNATTDLISTRDQLRQTQAQAAASAIEVQQLKTRLALVGNLPAANTPSRPGSVPSVSIELPQATVAPVAPPAAPAPRIHTVAPGDSLSKISKQYYGTAGRWNEILQANRDVISNPNSLALGTKLRIP